MSDREVNRRSSSTDTSFESSLVSKPRTSTVASELSCKSQKSSSIMMHNFLNYDPLNHSSGDTFYLSFTYFVSRSIGIGFLCLPYAFQQVGLVVGLALCFIAGLTFTYSFTTLCRLRYKICQIYRVPTVSYQNLIEYSLEHGPIVIKWFSIFFRFMFITTNLTLNFGKSCLYTKFVSSTFCELFTEMGFPVNYFTVSLSFDVICLMFLLLPYGKYSTPLRILSNFACTILLSLVFYNKFTSDMDIGCQTLITGNWTDIFQFFGILLFTFIPIVQVYKIENRLNRQEDFVKPFGLLNTSMILITNLYIAIGLCGYLDEQDIPGIGNPILKFLPGIRCRTIIKTCVAVNVTFFHRELNVESALLWASSIRVAGNGKKCHLPSDVNYSPALFGGLMAFFKIVFTFCSFFVNIAVASPTTSGFHVLVALIGYLGNACNMLIFPYIIEMCVTYALHGIATRRYVIAKDVCFVLLGLVVIVCGTFALVNRITQ